LDLALYFAVIRRFGVLIVIGAVLAVALAFLSTAKVDLKNGNVSYRQSQTWTSRASLLITQTGFPWGRAILPITEPGSATPPGKGSFADPSRFNQLATFYARLANGDAVQQMIKRDAKAVGAIYKVGSVYAQPTSDPTSSNGAVLPFVDIIGIARTPRMANQLAGIGTSAFRRYLGTRQRDARIPVSERVDVQLVNSAQHATLLQGRKKTLPIVIFLAVMIMTVGVAFLLENLRPRTRESSIDRGDEVDTPSQAVAPALSRVSGDVDTSSPAAAPALSRLEG
jgi:hypothetical protein